MNYFLHRYTGLHARSIRGVSHTAVNALLAYPFPGNVRELENMVERAVILAPDNGVIEVFHLFSSQNGLEGDSRRIADEHRLADKLNREAVPLAEQFLDRCKEGMTLQSFEAEVYSMAVAAQTGNLTKAARTFGLTRAQLAYRLRNLEVS